MNVRTTGLLTLIGILALGAGCASDSLESSMPQEASVQSVVDAIRDVAGTDTAPEPTLTVPTVDEQGNYLATWRRFGEYFDDGRFVGYHVAEDVEVSTAGEGDTQAVRAIADGVVVYKNWVSGYGGVVIVEHEIAGETLRALYGHVFIDSVEVEVGDTVTRGEQIAVLGEGETQQADGVREHLHFSVYEGDEIRLPGYVQTVGEIDAWRNPHDVLRAANAVLPGGTVRLSSLMEPFGRETFPIDVEIPASWDVEWIPQIEAWNLFEVAGQGSARERSQMLIRHFDASDFLTLSTVEIFETTDLTIGQGDYVARRYDIQKKAGVADFSYQPSWRNERHIVTDVRAEDGFTRYYVIAANPELDVDVYETVLTSLEIK